jgi:hypothetical protein
MRLFTNKFITLFFCLISSVGIVIILFSFSKRLNHRNNNFTRLFPPHFLSNAKQIDLKYNSYYFAGFTKNNIFLGNVTAAAFILKTNYDLNDSSHYILKVPKQIRMVTPAITVYLDSPDIIMLEGISSRILRGNLINLSMEDCGYKGLSFNESCVISNQSFAFRTYDQKLEVNILGKSTLNPTTIHMFPGILTRRGDGVFSLDGQMVKDPSTGNLIYVYFYRNEFIYLDTNLSILLKGKTIDSIQTPQIKIARINSESATTFSAPPLLVNKTCCADSNLLFVNSKLKANNEFEESFSGSSVIDIYTLKNGEYLYSFYVPDDNHVKMRSFKVFNNRLVALYDHTIMTFNIQY